MTGIMDYIDIARQIIEERLYGIRPGDLAAVSAKISNNYHSSNKTSQRLISDELQALVYAAVRMPATYAAVRSALEKSLMYNDINIDTVIDVGAGTGAASLAAADMFALGHLSLIEREGCMRKCGMEIFSAMQSEITVKAQWYDEDILNDNADRHADLVMSSYMINEIKLQDRENVFDRLWNMADKMLLIVEPGTKEGFEVISHAREYFLAGGLHIAAPCTHENKCGLDKDDWCHFSVRVARSRIHKLIKEADVPYEDEKFSYIAIVKDDVTSDGMRILRHPDIRKGNIGLRVCDSQGIRNTIITKKDGELFKKARKSSAGDII